MKQLNFSNIIAIVAVLLCFYAFSNDRKAVPQQTEKEFCFMRFDYISASIASSYSDGKYEEEDIKAYLKESKDNHLLRLSCKRMADMTNNGWDFAGINKDASPYATTYIFERSK